MVEADEAAKARERSEWESQEREKADLIAQQGMNSATQAMNHATQRMAFWSVVSTVMITIGTGLLAWTLIETRRMVKEAKDTTDAAVEAAEQAKRQADLSERAFIELEAPRVFPKIVDTLNLFRGAVGDMWVEYTVVNMGRSAAIVSEIRDSIGDGSESLGGVKPMFEVIPTGEAMDSHVKARWEKEVHPKDAGPVVLRIHISQSDGRIDQWNFVSTDRSTFHILRTEDEDEGDNLQHSTAPT